MSEILLKNNVGTSRKLVRTVTRTYEIYEVVTYSVKERYVKDEDILTGHEEQPLTVKETYLDIDTTVEEKLISESNATALGV